MNPSFSTLKKLNSSELYEIESAAIGTYRDGVFKLRLAAQRREKARCWSAGAASMGAYRGRLRREAAELTLQAAELLQKK
jgi:hypothetical protein